MTEWGILVSQPFSLTLHYNNKRRNLASADQMPTTATIRSADHRRRSAWVTRGMNLGGSISRWLCPGQPPIPQASRMKDIERWPIHVITVIWVVLISMIRPSIEVVLYTLHGWLKLKVPSSGKLSI
ncbi:hypothetical protein JAAARDRAFT_407002 [Jaapia argillacea MUCL 33604]|uniref:Uncharacterized protein n=1 Tax=Jaapia argillacea MUCL 33604 TaxID=933084 RepID=A0A067PSW4_9AGAM|nr:hypothetical protein JAAARDRAFT_407002 [Jaapia argillacea MUCL 33604]